MKKTLLILLSVLCLLLSGCKGSSKICGQKIDITAPKQRISVSEEAELTVAMEENVGDLSAISELVMICDDFLFEGEHDGSIKMSGFEWDKKNEITLTLKQQISAPVSGEIAVVLISDWNADGTLGRDTLSQTTTTRIYYSSDGDYVAFSVISLDDAAKKLAK